jgi:F-type H+-transporting ATPase subunit a
MTEHGTWWDFLRTKFSGLNTLEKDLGQALGREHGQDGYWEALMFTDSHWSLNHVIFAILVMFFVIFGALKFKAAVSEKGLKGLIPPSVFNLRNLFELLTDVTFGLMTSVMGEKQAKRFLPFIGALAFFILFSNLMALIPAFGVPTTTLKTNAALAILVFLVTHYVGIKEHGAGYLKHFMGPLPAIAPLMFVIEVVSHLARPVSLALRLMGNMAADHKVVFSFFTLVPLFIPVPFLLLGVLVSIVQTVVFCLLSMVYISMALSHDH